MSFFFNFFVENLQLNFVIHQQKLKDVAFPQAEVLKQALLKRFEQEYAQYLVKKVRWSTSLLQKCSFPWNFVLHFISLFVKHILTNGVIRSALHYQNGSVTTNEEKLYIQWQNYESNGKWILLGYTGTVPVGGSLLENKWGFNLDLRNSLFLQFWSFLEVCARLEEQKNWLLSSSFK